MFFAQVPGHLNVRIEHIFEAAVVAGEQPHQPVDIGGELPVHAGEQMVRILLVAGKGNFPFRQVKKIHSAPPAHTSEKI